MRRLGGNPGGPGSLGLILAIAGCSQWSHGGPGGRGWFRWSPESRWSRVPGDHLKLDLKVRSTDRVEIELGKQRVNK